MDKSNFKKYNTHLFLIFFGVLVLCTSTANAKSVNFSPITSIQGLSQNQVRCIHQDKTGFLWVGTQDGLNRYDGYEFKKYARNPFDKNSLSFDYINVISEDLKNNLWIGTTDGLDYFNPREEVFENYNYLLSKDKQQKTITSVTVLDAQNTLISTLRNIYLVTLTNGKYTSTNIPLDDPNIRFYKAIKHEHQVWISTNRGLISFNSTNQSIRQYDLPDKAKVMDFDIDSEQGIWLIVNAHLFKFNIQSNEYKKLPFAVKHPRSIKIDKQKYLWIGTSGNGLFKSKTSVEKNVPLNFSNITKLESINYAGVDIMVIYESDESDDDVIWAGTEAHGILQYSRSKQSFSNLFTIIQDKYNNVNSVYSIYKKENLIFAGTDKGLCVIDLETNESTKLKFGSVDPITQEIFEDDESNLWIGTNEGLYFRKKDKSTFTLFDLPKNSFELYPSIFKMNSDNQNNLMVGTKNYFAFIDHLKGIEIYDTITIDGVRESLEGVASLAMDAKHNLWIGTTKGLIVKSKKGYKRYQYDQNNKTGIIDNYINDIYISKSGTIWLATPKGISKVNQNDEKLTFTHFTEKDGLQNSYVYGILEDAELNLWLSTNRGIYKFDPNKKIFKSFSFAEQFGSDEFNSGAFFKDDEGNMYFGGINLLVKFNPKSIVENRHKPKLKIVECKIDEVDTPLSDNGQDNYLKISHSSNVVTIKLASLDFTNPSKNQYAYRIKGFHNDWIHLGTQRVLNLFNLPYNKSIIEFKSSNNEGIWNEDELIKVYINVLPPFWRQWWFYILSIAIITIIAYLFHRIQLSNKLAIERARLEENERVRKMASQDMHDEFGNSLTRITILTELIKSKLTVKKYDEAESLLSKIADNSSRLYQGTKDFIWSIRTDSDNLFEAVARIKDFADESMNSSNINFCVSGITDVLKDYLLPKASSRHVVMILKEAISNTLKHANPKSTLLSVKLTQDVLTIIWHDDGVGIQKKGDGNGLENMQSRSASIGGNLDIQSNVDMGTTIQLTLPIYKNEQRTR